VFPQASQNAVNQTENRTWERTEEGVYNNTEGNVHRKSKNKVCQVHVTIMELNKIYHQYRMPIGSEEEREIW